MLTVGIRPINFAFLVTVTLSIHLNNNLNIFKLYSFKQLLYLLKFRFNSLAKRYLKQRFSDS